MTVSDTFQAGLITASAILNAGIEVVFTAESSITLQQGFHAVAGVDFLAQIAPCASNFNSEAELYSFATIPTSTNLQPTKNKLEVFPNPFRNSTTLAYHLTTPSPVKLDIFDTTGKIVKRLINNQLANNGYYQNTLSKEFIDSGFYIARLAIGNEVFLKKLVVLER